MCWPPILAIRRPTMCLQLAVFQLNNSYRQAVPLVFDVNKSNADLTRQSLIPVIIGEAMKLFGTIVPLKRFGNGDVRDEIFCITHCLTLVQRGFWKTKPNILLKPY